MSTDFCVEAILQRSCSSSSLSSQRSPISQRSPHQQDKLTPSTNVPSQPVKRGLKRKHDDEENNGRPTKRGRTVFSQGQLHYLESVFAHTPYPDKLLKETIAEKLGLEQQRVHVWFQNRRSKQRKLSGHPAPQMTSVPKSLPTTHTVYPKTYIPDASMPVYFPLRSPSPVLSSGSLKSTPLSLSPPTYFSHLPFTATTLPSPTGPAVTQSSPTYLSQTQMPFQTITSPSPRFPYPRPPITEHNSCNNVSVVTLPSVFTNEVMSRQSFAVPNNRVGYY